MKKLSWRVWLVCFLVWSTGSVWSNASPTPDDPLATADALSVAFERAADRVRPAVVSIYSERTLRFRQWEWPFPFGDDFWERFFGQGRPEPSPRPQPRERRIPQRGTGSGIIVDKEGFILTNYHVVRDVEKINVQLADRRRFEAELIGFDEKTDVAIIRIKGRVPADLPVASLGDSDKLRVGEWVLAVGAPFGLAQTVTAGIISATGRANVGVADYEDFIQTDAAINPGNSGGPLVNLRGEVVGINTAIATAVGQFAGVGFAIPINMAKNMMPTLRKGEAVVRGFLGVIIQDVTDELAEQFKLPEPRGALVAQVNKDSPAEKAGLQPGDVILRYRDRPVQDTRELRNAVAATAPGTRAELVIWRDGQERKIAVTVGRLTPETTTAGGPAQPGSIERWGFTAQPLTAELAEEFGYKDQTGLLITEVQPDSPAAAAELQRGDLILEVNRQPVTSVAELREALAKSEQRALLLIRRRDASLFVVLRAQ
ncbi:MAG: DegQ family serine endoprotease [Verrucomicrobiae bacterium]|nr:DegQ family serine endoprotease [Verrucomicrobiae bacterium]